MNQQLFSRFLCLMALLVLAVPQALAQDPLNPVAEWRMDEDQWTGAVGEVVDSVGGLNGRARTGGGDNSFPTTEEAQVCNGGRFRGEGFNDPNQNNAYTQARHYVEIPDAGALSPMANGDAMTLTGWFQPESSNPSGVLLHKGQGGTSQEYRVSVNNNRVELTLWDQYGSSQSVQTTNLNLTAGQWYFFEATGFEYQNNRLFARVSVLDSNLNLLSSESVFDFSFFNRSGPGDYFDKPFNAPLLFGAQRFGVGSTPVSYFSGLLDEMRLHDQYFGTLGDFQSIASVTRQCSDPLTCFNDNYVDGQLNPDDWVTSVSLGNFTPQIVNGRLRMTEARGNQATAATLQREIPGAENLVVLEFDYYAYGGNGADGIAIALSDATVTPQPGSYGGSLGYAQRNNGDPGFAGGWLGIGIDEYGNFSNSSEGRQGGPGRRLDSVSIRGAGSGTTGYRYLQGTGSLSPGIDATGANSPHRYRITVDSRLSGQAIVSVERDTGGGYQTLIAPFNVLNEPGQPAVPENFLLSLTGSTGGSNNIHELDEFQLCALKLNPVGEQVDHFGIVHDGLALTCQPETVSIRACANADCSELFTDPVQATLSSAAGNWVDGNVVSLTNGVGEATLQNTTARVADLDVVGSQPSARPQSVTLCENGSGTLSAANCLLEFVDAGLAFDVPDMISHRTAENVQIRAVQKDPQTEACVPAFENVDREVAFYSNYISPGENGRPVSRPMSINGTDISISAASPTPVTLSFGAGGIAEVDVRYPDAGQLLLDARYQGSAANEDQGLVLQGRDDDFDVRPVGLCVTTAGACAAADISCDTFVKAEEAFDLSIQAVGWQSDSDGDFCVGNPDTPNFAMQNIALTSEVVRPAAGLDGVVEPASYNHVPADDGINVVPAKQSEVGVFRFVATPVPGGYFGETIPAATSLPAGRFYPDRFLVNADNGEFSAECLRPEPEPEFQSFAYFGQQFGWSGRPPRLEITPVSVEGNTTFNYADPNFTDSADTAFQRLSLSGITRAAAPTTDTAAQDLNNNLLGITVDQGSASLSVVAPGLLEYQYNDADMVAYNKTVTARVAPLETPSIDYLVQSIVDADGVSGAGSGYTLSPTFEDNFHIRYGRLDMDNVFGPENLTGTLPMPFRVEYWDGSQFVLNAADNCSSWDTVDIGGTSDYHTLQAASGDFVDGVGGPLQLSPNGTTGEDPTDRLVWSVPVWLQSDFSGDGTLENPVGLATFGVYRGNDRVIYWEER